MKGKLNSLHLMANRLDVSWRPMMSMTKLQLPGSVRCRNFSFQKTFRKKLQGKTFQFQKHLFTKTTT